VRTNAITGVECWIRERWKGRSRPRTRAQLMGQRPATCQRHTRHPLWDFSGPPSDASGGPFTRS